VILLYSFLFLHIALQWMKNNKYQVYIFLLTDTKDQTAKTADSETETETETVKQTHNLPTIDIALQQEAQAALTAPIVGGVVGTIGGMVAIGFVVWLFWHKTRQAVNFSTDQIRFPTVPSSSPGFDNPFAFNDSVQMSRFSADESML